MSENNATRTTAPAATNEDAATIPAPGRDVLTEILRDGAQLLLGQAIEAEVADWIGLHADVVDDTRRRRQVVRNGHHPPRTLVTGVGPVEVTQPRVLDRRIVGQDQDGHDVDAVGRPVSRFSSSILPPYLRKTKAIEELIPWLYLKGVSTGDFAEALQALVGPRAAGLAMVFKLCESAARKWRTLNGAKLLPEVIAGIRFVDGERTEKDAA